MIKTHKIKLNPNESQRQYFAQAAGTRRFVFNSGLAEWQRQWQAGAKPTALKLKKQFSHRLTLRVNALKGAQYPWVYAVTKCAAEGAFMDLADAFERFFSGQNGYPQFKRKHDREESFYLANDKVKVAGYFVKIPKLGWVNMSEPLRFAGKMLKVEIKQDKVGDWYAVIAVEVHEKPPQTVGEAVGIDLGVLRMATLSDGKVLENQKPLAHAEHHLKGLQRSLSRKQPGSRHWEKARVRLTKVHRQVQNIRLDILHKATTQLVTTYSFIGLETLNVKGMMHNHCLAKALGDVSLGLFRDLLVEKSITYGVTLQFVDRFFPSSKHCSNPVCRAKHETLTLQDRLFACPVCGLILDRDLNAAINIREEALRLAGLPYH